jgi:hypothetical protein
VHIEQLVSKILPISHKLDPSRGSYYSNASGLFHGDVRYYNLSSVPYDTNVTWKPIADRVMGNANLSAIPERLGSWNWSATDTIRIKVHDMMATTSNISESIGIFQVLFPPPLHVAYIEDHSQGRLEFFNPATADTTLLEFDGVHFTENGSFYAFAQEEGYVTRPHRQAESV